MESASIFAIFIATVSVVGAAIFMVKRSNLLHAKVEHELTIHPEAGKVVEHALTSASDTVGRVSDTLGKIGDDITQILEPVSSGVGEIFQSIAERIGAKQRELNKLQLQSIQQAQELERLKNRQLNITDVTAQLKLALISVNQEYPSLIQETVSEGKGEQTEYLAYFLAKYQVHLGVDIEKLHFQMEGDDCIRVFGLREPIIVGMTNLKVEEKLGEIRKSTNEKLFGVINAKKEILIGDSRLADRNREHHAKVLADIQSNQTLEYLKNVNAQFALAFLQACLSSAGHKVEESLEQLSNPIGFGQLCVDINRNVAKKIDFGSIKLLANEHEVKLIESEILAIASGFQ